MTDTTSTSGSVGAGHQRPTDSNTDFDVMTFIIRQMMAQLDTMKLVQVKAVHGGAGAVAKPGTVDVQLLVSLLDGSGNATPAGMAYGIPWTRVQGGKNAVICDPEVGDIGWVSCADRDISSVKAAINAGKSPLATPGSFRKYSVSDGIYVGGCMNVAPDQYLVFTATGVRLVDKNGNSVAMTSSGTTLTDSVGNVVSMASGGITITPASGQPCTIVGSLIVTQNLQLNGALQSQVGGTYAHNIVTSGNVVAGGVGLNTHTHTQPNDSHGDTEQPTSTGTG